MNAGLLGCRYHLVGFYLAKTGYIFTDCARKKFDVLWQIANVRTKLFLIPLKDIDSIQSNMTRSGWPNAYQNTRQSRFSRATGTYYSKHISGGQGKGDI